VQFGTHQVPWTGGSPGVLQEPVSHSAFRSQDSLKDAMKSEETCQEPLGETQRLGLPDHKNDTSISLTEWIQAASLHMRETGMDAVFFVRKNTNVATYVDLLEEWNRFSNDEINQWLEDETFDKYDRQNLRMSGTYMRNSIKIDLWRALEQTLQGRYEGPQIFVAIVRQHQVVGPLIVRELMAEIQAMNIQEEPGENVANMATKIYGICRRISGMVRTNEIPPDLPEICARVFLNTKTTTFNVVMTNILLYSRTETATWIEVLKRTMDEYHALAKGKNCEWLALRDHKEDPIIKAMQARIHSLEGSLSRKADDKNKSTTDDKDKHKNITCRKCKKKGHIVKNCPEKKEESKSEGVTDKEKGKKTGPTSPFKIPPKDNESKSKKIGDVDASWCSRCERWTKGEKRHLTEQHKTKAELQAQPAQVNVAASYLPSSGLSLNHFL